MMDEMNKIPEQLTNVRLDLRELSTKMAALKDVTEKLDHAEAVANKAMDSVKAAHHRLNKIDKLIFWLATTVFGAIIFAGIGYALRGGLNK